jgi:hypothetical protein
VDVRVVGRESVAATTVTALGLDPSNYAPDSDEALACAIRRIAAMSCPCPRRSMLRAAAGALAPIVPGQDLSERVDDMIDSLVAHGDLADVRTSEDEFERASWVLHAAPPAFVLRHSGSVILLGIAPDDVFPLPRGLQRRIRHRGCVRLLEDDDDGNLSAYLSDFGLLELSLKTWLAAPTSVAPEELLREANALLDSAPGVGTVSELCILDWETPVTFYRRRWVEPRRHTGRFIARRPQAHGAPLWCYVELAQGHPKRLLDLPRDERHARGCDEAWRIQAAIDACRGHPQRFRRRPVGDEVILDFFGPLPRWADRRFAAFGEAAAPSRCLFSRRFQHSEVAEELDYIHDELWLEEAEER